MIKKIVIEEEEVFMTKGFDGWRVIYPYKIDGKYNWKNILLGGSWFKFFKWTAILLIIFFLMMSYKSDMNNCIQYAADIMRINCEYNSSLPTLNWSNFNG